MTRIRPLTLEDAEPLANLLHVNREFLAPWNPVQPPEFFTPPGQRAAIARLLEDESRGVTVAHVILDEGDRIVGRVTLSNIHRLAFQSCNLGYWVSSAENGRGHASAAVAQMAQVAFSELGLHRLEAGTLPHNIASQRVLAHNEFERIGLARRYLKIAGRWQDHVLFQKLAPDASARVPVE